MANYILIHGASHGAWCWEQTAAELTALGHRALAFDLPGSGSDGSDRRCVSVSSYISAVEKRIKDSGFDRYVIVGHSLAGRLLQEIAARSTAAIEEVVFLAALVVLKGEAAIDLIPEYRRAEYYTSAGASSDNSLLFPFETARSLYFSDLPLAQAQEYYKKLTPQPLSIYLESLVVEPHVQGPRYRYLLCKDDQCLPRELCLTFAERLSVPPEMIDGGHGVMLSRPALLARQLAQGGKG